MANPVRGEVALVLNGGVETTLRFTTSALASLQDALGFEHSASGCAKFFERFGRCAADDLALFFSHATRARHRELRDVSVAVHVLAQLQPLVRLATLRRAITLAFPEPAPEKPGATHEPFTWENFIRTALRSGMSEREFWNSTPRQVARRAAAAAWRRDRVIETAWLNAAWARRQVGKMPDLNRFLSEPTTRKPVAMHSRAFMVDLAQRWRSTVTASDGTVIVEDGNVMPAKEMN